MSTSLAKGFEEMETGEHEADDNVQSSDLRPGHYSLPISKRTTLAIVSLSVALFAVTVALIVVALRAGHMHSDCINCPDPGTTSTKKPKNIVLMIADGFGPASETMARDFVNEKHQLTLDRFLVGTSRTHSADTLVTDSAAGATAFSCATKANNYQVAWTPDNKACGTLLEAAELQGYNTGLVVTSRITHATPAAFSSHVVDRNMEADIAVQQSTKGVDVIFGGGRKYYIPKSQSGSSRPDERDLLKEMVKDADYNVITTAEEFRDLSANKKDMPIIGLFGLDHLPYELDRDASAVPRLDEMVATALQILEDAGKPFFLMVEGSRIDHAGHVHDPASHIQEILVYNDAADVIQKFAAKNKETLVVSVADHETGGLTLGREVDGISDYVFYVNLLKNVSRSAEYMASKVLKGGSVGDVLHEYTGLTATAQDTNDLEAARMAGQMLSLTRAFSDVVSRHAHAGWTTYAHTGVDVNVYALGPKCELFRGNHDNTEIGQMIADVFSLDLAKATKHIKTKEVKEQPTTKTTSARSHHGHSSTFSRFNDFADAIRTDLPTK